MAVMIAPPPPANQTKPVAFFDTECYPNYWLLKFGTPGTMHTFELRNGERFDTQTVGAIGRLFNLFTVVSFNGNHYDIPMIIGALCGYDTGQLKYLNDEIIVGGVKPWQLNLPKWSPSDHIDVMEVAPGPKTGLKQYAARIHCHKIQDLPYSPNMELTDAQMVEVAAYCENDIAVLSDLYYALTPLIDQRIALSKRYGIDLRSKSDAQLAEAVLRKRCELANGRRIEKPQIDYNLAFRYEIPPFISYSHPALIRMLELVRESVFRFNAKGDIALPAQLEGLEIGIGASVYKIGIGGLHSKEKCVSHYTDENVVLNDNDVEAYYPNLILNSGKWPSALGAAFLTEYEAIKTERVANKAKQSALEKAGDTVSVEYAEARAGNEGGKIMINGTFGKTGSSYSVLFAPEMLIQTTITGQLSLLMLIEWHEACNIPVVSANTDGIVTKCPRDMLTVSQYLISEWEARTGLKMETVEYRSIHARDVNNYFAVKADGKVKRKGEYAKSGLMEKKNPDCEICSDAVAEYLANGTDIAATIRACRDLRKFITVTKVAGGGVKLWGDGPRKGAKVADMVAVLERNGWVKVGRAWCRDATRPGIRAQDAYQQCFAPQRPEYLGKVVRWYYSTQAPGPIVYASNGNNVSLSWGANPCMTLPGEFPSDIDYDWYIEKARNILVDVGK